MISSTERCLTLPSRLTRSVARSVQQESVELKGNPLTEQPFPPPTTSLSPLLLRYSPGQSNQLLEYAYTTVSRPLFPHVNSNRFIKFPRLQSRRHQLDTLDTAGINSRELAELLVSRMPQLCGLRGFLTLHAQSNQFRIYRAEEPLKASCSRFPTIRKHTRGVSPFLGEQASSFLVFS